MLTFRPPTPHRSETRREVHGAETFSYLRQTAQVLTQGPAQIVPALDALHHAASSAQAAATSREPLSRASSPELLQRRCPQPPSSLGHRCSLPHCNAGL